jgi:general secretion pathway protein A
MYTDYYGFTERPFDVSPDPKFLHLTDSHRETLASMLYGIREKRGFLAVTGEVGTGKTTVINALLNSLDEKVKTAYILRKCTTVHELLRAILYEFGVPAEGRDRFELWQRLNEYVLEVASRHEAAVLIIDEAQNLTSRMLEEIRTLSNLETQKTKLLQIILVGQPELDAKLNSEELRQLRQRIAIRRKLLPLSNDEVEAYIKHRLKLVGGIIYGLFTRDAVALIGRYSKGIPRVINIMCDNAFLIGYALAQKKVDGAIIREVIKDMDGEPSPSLKTRGAVASSGVQRSVREGDGFLRAFSALLRSLLENPWGRLGRSTVDPASRVTGSGTSRPHQGQEGE